MKKTGTLQSIGLATALVLGACFSASATIDMTFTWADTHYEAGYSDTYINSSDAIGIYEFNTSGNGIPNPFYSVCLSPAGLLDGNTHTYNILSFSEAGQGIYPTAWAQSGGPNNQQWGINNAAWLWNTYGMNIVNNKSPYAGQQNQAAAALEFAVWTVLYDSSGYGKVTGNSWTAPTGQMDATTLAYYNGFIDALTASGISGPTFTGNVLESTIADTGAGSGGSQEFFMLGTPVPEPTTLVAGALLLLPFGASTLRLLRRRHSV